ncbi:MAG TPA: inorganic diphosphatase [Solirubrobacteraceae bacterium]|nr:inorganic diphosphatase [Solirubrobacteraceae bacterium]
MADRDGDSAHRAAGTDDEGRAVAAGALVCVVEIPKGTRNKYEYDPALGGIKFDRLLMSSATYPTDYGYLRDTLAPDGDPLDALVCLYEPTFPGCLIPVRAIGMFKMRDEKGVDDKIICVPLHDPYWNGYEHVEELPLLLRQEIEQFFSIYKELEEGGGVEIGGWCAREDAVREIEAARARAGAAAD